MATTAIRAHSARNNPSLQSKNLRIAIGAALEVYGISETRFGRNAVGDPRFVLDIFRHNREARPATAAKVRAYISSLGGRA